MSRDARTLLVAAIVAASLVALAGCAAPPQERTWRQPGVGPQAAQAVADDHIAGVGHAPLPGLPLGPHGNMTRADGPDWSITARPSDAEPRAFTFALAAPAPLDAEALRAAAEPPLRAFTDWDDGTMGYAISTLAWSADGGPRGGPGYGHVFWNGLRAPSDVVLAGLAPEVVPPGTMPPADPAAPEGLTVGTRLVPVGPGNATVSFSWAQVDLQDGWTLEVDWAGTARLRWPGTATDADVARVFQGHGLAAPTWALPSDP